MKTIVVDARLGVTMFNLSEEVIQKIRIGSEESYGSMRLNVDDAEAETASYLIRREVVSRTGLDVEVNRIGSSIISIKPVDEDEDDEDGDEDRDEDEEGGGVEVEDEYNHGDDDEAIRIDHGVANEAIRIIETPEPEPRPIQAQIMPVIEVSIPERVEGNQALIMIGSILENEISNLAKNLYDKQKQFNLLWTKVISLKREIDEIVAPIENNELISNLMGQVSRIKDNDQNAIRDIFFAQDHIVAITEELSTDVEIDGTRRMVGSMMIKIMLKPIIGETSECLNPIIINNMTRNYFDGSNTWECGHVKRGGMDMCWGNAWEMLFRAMSDRDVDSILEVVIRFIKNPNVADVYGRHMKNWPQVQS